MDLFGRPGWKTQDFKSNSALRKFKVEEEEYPFIGFGRCHQKTVSLDKFRMKNHISDQIESYLIPLRAQCDNHLIDALVKIFEHGGLSRKTFSDGADHDFFRVIPSWEIL